jgi:Skp family chaperone for outer membrane proteins
MPKEYFEDEDADLKKREEKKLQEQKDAEDRDSAREEYLKRIEQEVQSYTAMSSKRRQKLMESLKENDQKLRTALALVLNYYAENGEFNQILLEDVVPFIASRAKILRKVK